MTTKPPQELAATTQEPAKLILNNKRTFLLGLAFFGILMLWQVYYVYVPLYLEDTLISRWGKTPDDWSYIIGLIMSLDNVFALFLIPIFSWFSDKKTRSRYGRRIPYIFFGTIAAAITFPLLAVMAIVNSLVWMVIMMVLVIIAMGVYRSPAVSLMPDVTPKPLRSKANAIINFVGYIGAVAGTGLTMIFTMDNKNLTIIPFLITAAIMIGILVVLMLKFKENKVVEEMRADMKRGEELSETLEKIEEDKPMGRRDKVNIYILMGAVFLCFFAFNALNTFGSLYAKNVLKVGTGEWGLCSTALALASLATFLPSIKLTKKIGRKNSIMLGLALIIVMMLAGGFINSFGPLLVALFAVSGIGWAIINVNTMPMLVEMSSRANVARMVAVYYVASQVAHALTSIVVGFVFTWLGYKVYFFYAAFFMSIAFVLCFFFKVRKITTPLSDVTKHAEVEADNASNQVKSVAAE